MNKNIFLIAICLVLCAGAFASGSREDSKSVAITGGYQGNFLNYENEGTKYKEAFHGISIGIDIREMFTDVVGLHGHVALNLPMAVTETFGNNSINLQRNDFGTLLGIDIYMGPMFMPIKQEKLTLNISPLVHFGMMMAKRSLSDAGVMMLGLGADVSANYFFHRKGFFTGGIIASFDFLSLSGNGYSSQTKFNIEPKLGIGFQW